MRKKENRKRKEESRVNRIMMEKKRERDREEKNRRV